MDRVITSYEDLKNDQVIFFVQSGEGRHRINRYKVGDAATSLVLEWEGFGWDEHTQITGVGLVGDILVWAEGLEREIRSLNITKKADYDLIKADEPDFLNLIKRPPLLSLDAFRVDYDKAGPNLILDHSFVFSYRYVYADDETSVLAPYSEPVHLPFNGTGQDDFKEIQVTQTSGTELIPALVKKIEFLARRDSETVWHNIRTVEVEPGTPVSDYAFRFDNTFLGNAIAEDDALRPYDAIWPAKALTVARNRIFYANFAEGYEDQGDASMTIALQTAPPVAGQRIFKSNSSQRFGIVYYDAYGRNMGVLSKPEWQVNTVPTLHKDATFNYVSADLSLTLAPPAWAKYWRLVKSPDLGYSFFVQGYGYVVVEQDIQVDNKPFIVYNQYTIEYNGKPSILKNLYIEIASLTDRGVGYIFEQGDMVNIYYEGFFGPRQLASVPILGQQGNLLKIPLSTPVQIEYSVYRGLRFEIIRAASNAENVFYETHLGGAVTEELTLDLSVNGDVWLLPSTAVNNREYGIHSVNGTDFPIMWNQADSSGKTLEQVGVEYPWMEAMSPWDRHYARWSQNLGRISAVLPERLRRRILKPNSERFSNKFLSGTQLNGISSFEGLNEKDLPLENGPINKLQLASNAQAEGTVLLAIMQNETESQYLNEAQWRDTQGRTTSAISDAVIGATNTLRGGYGTLHPESVIQKDGRVYFFDLTKAEVVRYSVDGLTPLAKTYKMQQFFQSVQKRLQELGQPVTVQGGYDAEMDEYLLTFSAVLEGDTVVFPGFTIAFSEKVKGFVGYTFTPECYGKSNTSLVSFLSGKLYLHGANPVHNNFYGEQHTSSIRFLSNMQPHMVKVWQAVAIEGEELWVPTELANDKGQLSRMRADWFENREGVYYGAIRRDLNSKGFAEPARALNSGEVLRSQVLEILIECDSVNQARLDAVNVNSIDSSGHTEIN